MSKIYNRKVSDGKVSVVITIPGTYKREDLPKEPPLDFEQAMMRKGMSSLKTPSGFVHSEASSSMQKAVRRMDSGEAVQWALELFWTSQNSRTNVWNRLLVMCIEDVSPKDHRIIEQVYDHYITSRDDPLALATCVDEIARAVKSRMYDWSLHANRNKYFADRVRRGYHADSTDGDFNRKEYANELKSAIESKDLDRMIYACCKIWYSNAMLARNISSSKKAENLIWLVISKVSKSTILNKYASTLYNVFNISSWKYSNKSAMLWSAFCNIVAAGVSDNPHRFEINQNIAKPPTLVGVPDHALDMHTRKGKEMGRGFIYFIEESSSVADEDEDFIEAVNQYIEDSLPLRGFNFRSLVIERYYEVLSKKPKFLVLSSVDGVWVDVAKMFRIPVFLFTSKPELYSEYEGIEVISSTRQMNSLLSGPSKMKVFVYDKSTPENMMSNVDRVKGKWPTIELVDINVFITADNERMVMDLNEHQLTVYLDTVRSINEYTKDMVYVDSGRRTNLGGKTVLLKSSKWVNTFGSSEEGLENYTINLFKTGKVYDIFELRNKEIVCISSKLCHGHVLVALVELYDCLIGLKQ